VAFYFLQFASGSVGRDHHGSPGLPKPAGSGLEPDLRRRGGGDAAAAAGRRSGTDCLFIGTPVMV